MNRHLALLAFSLMILPLSAAIEIQGGTNFNTVIPNGDTTPRTLDGTEFGTVTIPGSKTLSFRAKATGTQETIVDILEDGAAWSITSGAGFGVVPAGSSRTFSVKLDPTSAGYKSATVSIVTTGAVYTFTVGGTALGEPEIVVGRKTALGIAYLKVSDGDTSPRTADGTAFGGRGVSDGALSVTFEIENTGTGQLVIDSITDDSPHFSISGAPAVVGVNQTQTFSVKFNPTSYGTKTAVITIQNNDANEDPFTFTVSGIGEAPEIQVLGGSSQSINITNGDSTPRALDNTDFGTVAAGSVSINKVFKISNNGNENLIVSLVSEDANAFSLSGAPNITSPIPPGGSDNFTISLNTTAAGTKSGTVTIISNDPDNAVFTFDITAEATGEPEIAVKGRLSTLTSYITIPNNSNSPTTTNGTEFGSRFVDDGFVEHTFEIENSGTSKLNISSITDDSAAFSVVSAPSSVGVGQTQTFGIRFNPSAFGEKTATITIENDDPSGGEDRYTFEVAGLALFPKVQLYGGTNFGEFIGNGDNSPSVIEGTDFGTVAAGSGSVTKTFRIRNEGNSSLTLLAIVEDGAAFSFTSLPTTPTVIATGSSLDFSVKFEPSSAGSKSATVTLLTSDTVQGRDEYQFDIVGEASGVAELELKGRQLAALPYQAIANGDSTPTAIDGTDFGTTPVGSGGVTRTFQISNTGSAQLTIDSIAEKSLHFSVSGVPSVIGVNQSKTFDVTFDPSRFGSFSTTIDIFTDGGSEEAFSFKVKGTAEAGRIEVFSGRDGLYEGIPHEAPAPPVSDGTSTGGQDFGTRPVDSPLNRSFSIYNSGNAPLTLAAITEDGNAWETDGSPSTIAIIQPDTYYNFSIDFVPTSGGYKAATVSIFTSDPDIPVFTFGVAGIATGDSGIAVLGRATTQLPFLPIPDGSSGASTANGTEFGDRGVESGSTTRVFQITNDGNSKLNISSIVEFSPHFRIAGAPSEVGVGVTKDFTIAFNPTSLGPKTANITITSDAPGELSSYTFTVRGIGEAPDIAVSGGINFGENIANGDTSPNELDGTDFGNVNVNTAVVARTFRIDNNGNETLVVTTATINNSAFDIINAPLLTSPIAPGDFREFTISYHPFTTGFATATLSIFSNDPDEDPFLFSVEGFGTDDTPNLTVVSENGQTLTNGQTALSSSVDFGEVELTAATEVMTYTLENRGTGYLTITSVTENGARFNILAWPTDPIGPGESAEFDVRFNPDVLGQVSATVTILSNDPDESPFSFAIAGTGVNTPPPTLPEIAVKGGQNLDVNIGSGDITPRVFDGTNVGTIVIGESKERTFRIENSGEAVLNISEVALVGAPSAVASFPATIPAGGSGDFTVTLTPQSAGTRDFTLRIVSDDADEATFTFLLSGIGVDPVNMLEVTNFEVEGQNLQLTFISNPASTYQIAWSADLLNWNRPSTLGGILGDVNEQSYLITGVVNASNPRVFLRVEEE